MAALPGQVPDEADTQKRRDDHAEDRRQILRHLKGMSAVEQEALKKQSLEFFRSRDNASEDFDFSFTVGRGRFARVRKATHKQAKQGDIYPICLKIMRKHEVIEKDQVDHISNEKNTLASVRHPFAIRLFGTFQDGQRVIMILEFINGGELFLQLRHERRFKDPKAKFYAQQVISVIFHLQEMLMIYRDLKPENILIDHQGNLKLTDFGFAKFLTNKEDKTYTACGTPQYMAPEVIRKKGHGLAVDWWAIGVLIYELVSGNAPFAGDTQEVVFGQILSGRIIYPANISDGAKDIVKRFCMPDQNRRLGTSETEHQGIKDHKWFKGTDWNDVELMKEAPPWVPGEDDNQAQETIPDSVEPTKAVIDGIDQKLFDNWKDQPPDFRTTQIAEAVARLKRREQEREDKKKAEEDERKRLEDEEAAKIKAEEDAAKKKIEDEERAKREAEEEKQRKLKESQKGGCNIL